MRKLARNRRLANHCLAANAFTVAGQAVPYCGDLLLPLSRLNTGFRAVAAMPAARSFAIRLMSFTGTGLVSGKWTVPFRRS